MNDINDQRSVKKMVVLHGGWVVDGDIYDRSLAIAQGSIDCLLACTHLDGREEFTSERLCGEEQWRIWTNDEKRTAGRCLVCMAMTNILPLEIVGCDNGKHVTPKRFRIKNNT